MEAVTDARAAIARAEKFATENYNYLSNDGRAVVAAHLAVAWAMCELVAVSQPEPAKHGGRT